MTDETRQAFAHPEERAASLAKGQLPPDRISLRDHVVTVEIGAFQTERGVRQRLRFDIVVEVTGEGSAAADDVDRILSYDRLTEAVAAALGEQRLNLLETLAERVAALILREPQALRVFVRIEKLDRGPGALGVEIVRGPVGQGATEPGALGPRPRVAFLADAVISDSRLGQLLDRLGQIGGALILCVGLPAVARPEAVHPLAQRRIDLLAMEQNAWVLAARDKRCIVTGTRTELDWAMKHGQISVWAPSKIVLDSVDVDMPEEPLALAAWFAARMDAVEVLVVGAGPVTGAVPVRGISLDEALG
jgi:dihydroneopterin aldolase